MVTWMFPFPMMAQLFLLSGVNVVLAVACQGGYNQEDSLIANQTAIDRGLFSSMHFKTYSDEIQKNPNTAESDKFTKPDKSLVADMREQSAYGKLRPDGLCDVETKINNDEVIIGKVTTRVLEDQRGRKYKDASTVLRNYSGGVLGL